ncbi:hypothetical protein [Chamaesiphon sp. OTE_20_metabat_361]|uniref:hypothetical protein n=1 Tax=Chamaesiphon sp. OTE_20_metabat_361 TaxID=2964689 RepID=UPI00286AA4DD|nr:hypothetical protein [Chamaesiphon sp. OTE_20_metabat_361]
MAKKCYKINTVGCDNNNYEFFRCSEGVTTGPTTFCGNLRLIDVEGTFTPSNGSCKSATIVIVSCSFCPNCCTNPLDPAQPYDCINGNCLPKTTYSTPGKYASLTACQSGCAKDSNCSGECVSAAEIAALQQAASLVRNKLCG